jgi:hypothetical protein
MALANLDVPVFVLGKESPEGRTEGASDGAFPRWGKLLLSDWQPADLSSQPQ